MFLKRCQRRKSGKTHTYWALVESVRTARGSRHQVVAYLGELQAGEQAGWARLGEHLTGADIRRRPQRSLFDPPEPAGATPVEQFIHVRTSGVRLEHLRDFGDVWLAWGLWRMLELDVLCERLFPRGREDVPWSSMAALLTIARFCEPSSELHIEDTWYRKTALEDLLGVPPDKVHTDRLYTTLDRLLPHKTAIEQHLRNRFGDLFNINCELLLYDVTSTYFEGDAAENELAKRGYSRDSRSDRPQVCIGLVVTDEGFPLACEVFAGNTHDSKTMQSIVETMEARHGQLQRIWVMDRGMVSEANLKNLRDRDAKYIVGTPKAMLSRFEKELAQPNWSVVQEGVEVQLVAGPEGNETFILARSADRRLKEQAMREKFATRMEEGLQRMHKSILSGRLKDARVARERLGRLRQRNWRGSALFEVEIEPLATREGKAHLRLNWKRSPKLSDWATLSEGCYLLRTNLKDVDACTLWKRYIQLTEAEWAFRIAKDELSIRPVWHQTAERVRGHILVCFLAYALWKTLAGWMQRSHLGDAPRTVLEEFQKIKCGDVVLPARNAATGAEREVRLRCVTEPDAAQRSLLAHLGLTLPRRLHSRPPLGDTMPP